MLWVYFRDFTIKDAELSVTRLKHVALFEFFWGESAEFAYLYAVMVEDLALLSPILGALAADDVLEAGRGGASFRGNDGSERPIERVGHRKWPFLEFVIKACVGDELPRDVHLLAAFLVSNSDRFAGRGVFLPVFGKYFPPGSFLGIA